MNNGHSRTSIFLMEIIISVLLFSLASAVCVKLFVHTHIRNNDTHALTRAISEAQSVTEIIRSTADAELTETNDAFCTYYPLGDISHNGNSLTMNLFYDQDFLPCNAGLSKFKASVDLQVKDTFCYIDIEIQNDKNESIFSIHTQKYIH